MRGKVAMIGCRGVALGAWRDSVARMKPDDLHRESFTGFAAIVLGAAVIQRIVPQEAWSSLGAVRARVVLCDEVGHPYGVVRPWTRCGFGEPAHPDEIEARVAALDRPHLRPWLEFERWLPCPTEPNSPAAEAAAAVFHLRRFQVDEWTARLRWSEGRLQRTCIGAFAISPKHVLWRYVARAYPELRAAGATDAECVVALGSGDPKSLHRALRSAAAAERKDAEAVRIAQVSSSNRPVQEERDRLS